MVVPYYLVRCYEPALAIFPVTSTKQKPISPLVQYYITLCVIKYNYTIGWVCYAIMRILLKLHTEKSQKLACELYYTTGSLARRGAHTCGLAIPKRASYGSS